jgi:adenosylhomocysteinase
VNSRDPQQTIPERLPLLDALVARHGERQPLHDVHAGLIQHQTGSTVCMVQALFALGLEPTQTFFVDIPYSANGEVREALERLGIPNGHFADGIYDLAQPYAQFQRRRVQDVAARVFGQLQPDDVLVVLDDGAYFVEAASCFAHRFGDLRVVEQTTRGIIKLDSDAAMRHYISDVPVVDVARSDPKRRLEGPWIGEVVCQALLRQLGDQFAVGAGQRALVAGYGVVGQAVAASLVSELGIEPSRVHVSDPSPDAQSVAIKHGFTLWDRESAAPTQFKLVVGCSGRASFGIGDRVFLEDGAVLASASSGSGECSREEFVELAETHPSDHVTVLDPKTLATRSIHDPIDILLVDRTVRFLNGGFPVNFDGRVNCVAPERIQVTHALMIGAVLQAVKSTKRGIIPLSPDICAWVKRTYEEMSDVSAGN